jgi:hypothetical protein
MPVSRLASAGSARRCFGTPVSRFRWCARGSTTLRRTPDLGTSVVRAARAAALQDVPIGGVGHTRDGDLDAPPWLSRGWDPLSGGLEHDAVAFDSNTGRTFTLW